MLRASKLERLSKIYLFHYIFFVDKVSNNCYGNFKPSTENFDTSFFILHETLVSSSMF